MKDAPPDLCIRDLSRLGWAKFDEGSYPAALPGLQAQIAPLFRVYGAAPGAYARYSVYVPADASDNFERERSTGKLFTLLHVVMARYRPCILTVTRNGQIVAQIHAAAPNSDGVWRFELSDCEMARDEVGAHALDLDPILPAGVRQWSCTSNELYGLRKMLVEYAEIGFDAPIMGKLQHSWQPSFNTGIDGEWGFKPEVTQLDLPVFVWSSANLKRAKEEGLMATAIGCPIIYNDWKSAPPGSNRLLAFPTHSIGECIAVVDWKSYMADLCAKAKSLGLEGVTICLHHEDTNSATATGMCDVRVVSIGTPRSDNFMRDLHGLILRHTAVTSDRVSTSGLYAMFWGRPFFVHGEPIKREPPAYDADDLTGNRDWIEANFPGLLKGEPVLRHDLACRELGAEHEMSHERLRTAIWGWMGL